jgi:hypothetical protein
MKKLLLSAFIGAVVSASAFAGGSTPDHILLYDRSPECKFGIIGWKERSMILYGKDSFYLPLSFWTTVSLLCTPLLFGCALGVFIYRRNRRAV